MKSTVNKKAFTLVELLVVITILAIISVVAYQNFGGAVDKAVGSRKITDVSTIESSLQQYKVDKNFYPSVDGYNGTTNMWGYDYTNATVPTATPSNTLVVAKTGEAIDSITSANGGGIVFGLNDGTTDWTGKQVGAKGTISQNTISKKYLTKDLYDPELGDVKVAGSGKMIDSGLGRYVYAVFKKPLSGDTSWGTNNNKEGTYYNMAYTIKVEGGDKYITKVVGDYDSESCFDEKTLCPNTLIGSGTGVLIDGQENSSSNTSAANQGIPYPVNGY
ncbi:MAG: type II secretion system protein [Candidatus Gracilibacteria bacterium]|nr:type II secretion system protein [Candidatus Gracilibacteria bacterium]